LSFPQEGISITDVNKFIELCGGKSLRVGMTTTEVNNELMPQIFAYKTSHCGLLDRRKQEQQEVDIKRVTIDTMCTCEDVDRMENKLCAW
jgi:hypothetical protein